MKLYEGPKATLPKLEQPSRWIGVCFHNTDGKEWEPQSGPADISIDVKVRVKQVNRDGKVDLDRTVTLVEAAQFGPVETPLKEDTAKKAVVHSSEKSSSFHKDLKEKKDISFRMSRTEDGTPLLIQHQIFETTVTRRPGQDQSGLLNLAHRTESYCGYNPHPTGYRRPGRGGE